MPVLGLMRLSSRSDSILRLQGVCLDSAPFWGCSVLVFGRGSLFNVLAVVVVIGLLTKCLRGSLISFV